MAKALQQITGDIAVVGLPGSYLSSIGTPVDALALIASEVQRMFAPPYRLAMESKVVVLTPRGAAIPLSGSRHLSVDGNLDWARPLQLVYIAAFEAEDEASLLKVLSRQSRLMEWLRQQHGRGAVIGAAGVANFVLAEAGLLHDGAAAPGAMAAIFRRRYPRIRLDRRSRIVEHGGVFTGSGLADEWTLAIRLVERCLSPHTSRWLSTAAGLQRNQDDSLSDDPVVAAAQFWLGERFARLLKISELARDLSISHTTLLRRFQRSLSMTPRRYVQTLRIEAAKKMLMTTRRSIQQVGNMVGYADTRSFRLAFLSQVGMTPKQYRERGR